MLLGQQAYTVQTHASSGKSKVSVLTTSSKAFTLDTNHTYYTTDHILLPASSFAVTQLTQKVTL